MIPEVLQSHYAKFPVKAEEGKIDAFSQRDRETHERLMRADAAWCDLEKEVGAELLPRVFDALWIANLDWNAWRGDRKKASAAKIAQIKATKEKLEKLLDEFRVITAPAGGGPGRNPDAWPDSPVLRKELAALIERCEKFNLDGMAADSFANAAMAARESGQRVYLRALVAILDEAGFPFGESRTPSKALIDLANAATGDNGCGIDYDAFYAVLQPERKSKRK